MKANRRLIAMAASLAVVAGAFVASPATAATQSGQERRYGSPLTTAEIASGDAAITKIRDLGDAITTVHGAVHFDAAIALEGGALPLTVRQVAVGIVAGGGTVSGITVDADEVGAVAHVVLDSLAAGAGIATTAAIITSETGVRGIAGALIAGVLASGGGAIAFCAADGNGVIIDQGWNGVPWCAGQ